jgi:hypothetical protein
MKGLREGKVFAHLDEFDDVAARAAGEAFEDLLCGVDVEAWAMVFVEGTQAHHFASFAFERKVLAYDIDNVIGLLNTRN